MQNSDEHANVGKVLGLGVALAALVSVILLAFLWPAVTAEAKNLPLALAGPQAQTSQIEASITGDSADLFKISTVENRDAAVDLVKSRQVYGAIVLAQKPEVLVSTAASAAVAAKLGGFAPVLQAHITKAMAAQGITPPAPITVAVTDVVPLSSNDSSGAIISASAFPLVIGGVIGGVIITLLIGGVWRRLCALLVLAVVAGFAIAGILQGWFGGLQGEYWMNVSAISLAVFAIGGVVVGLGSLIGRGGLALGAVFFILFANPLAATAVPKEFIVAPWGEVGQWMPPGAAGTLLRDLSYFPNADALMPWLVLAGWALLGLVLIAIAGAFRRAPKAQASNADVTQESVTTS
ncbi:MAG: hypothetical protein IT191_05065 [Microbacteriaceae bacterium]|nr:hypothetical protein [Cryobacterium sp.]MCC6376370.1 hypothetical protein [Microbacteriaceae bacterium]